MEKNSCVKGLKMSSWSRAPGNRHAQFQSGRKTSVWLVTGYAGAGFWLPVPLQVESGWPSSLARFLPQCRCYRNSSGRVWGPESGRDGGRGTAPDQLEHREINVIHSHLLGPLTENGNSRLRGDRGQGDLSGKHLSNVKRGP